MKENSVDLRVGCAGWKIPKPYADQFPQTGTHLERYAVRFPAVEINSSFNKHHQPATYARWAESVPERFQFSVKIPSQITHSKRLADPGDLDGFLKGVRQLETKLGPLLIQLPPSLAYDVDIAPAFLEALRERFQGRVVCEPRHASWFKPEAEKILREFQVARVATDPALVPESAEPGGWTGLVYYRLHGSPKMYYTSYPDEFLDGLVTKLERASSAATWCIFDNTASGAATVNALRMLKRLCGNCE